MDHINFVEDIRFDRMNYSNKLSESVAIGGIDR